MPELIPSEHVIFQVCIPPNNEVETMVDSIPDTTEGLLPFTAPSTISEQDVVGALLSVAVNTKLGVLDGAVSPSAGEISVTAGGTVSRFMVTVLVSVVLVLPPV
jgi:hypothetical protein